jgi:hypothetical protein
MDDLLVFHLLLSKEMKKRVFHSPKETPWWFAVEGAYWKHPEVQIHPLWRGWITRTSTYHGMTRWLVKKKYPWGNKLTYNGNTTVIFGKESFQ